MRKTFILTAFIFIIGTAFQVLAQDSSTTKVANYSFGKYGQKNYEHFSFAAENGKRSTVTYSYGKDAQEVEARYLDAKTIQGRKGFEIKLPNGLVLFVIPTDNNLRVIAPRGNYNKIFKWEYEGPVDGRGMTCAVCAENETEAMALIRKGYFN